MSHRPPGSMPASTAVAAAAALCTADGDRFHGTGALGQTFGHEQFVIDELTGHSVDEFLVSPARPRR